MKQDPTVIANPQYSIAAVYMNISTCISIVHSRVYQYILYTGINIRNLVTCILKAIEQYITSLGL